MSVSAKCKFANLKYEQLLSEKYFVETCFSKKYESYTSKEKLRDSYMSFITDCSERGVTYYKERRQSVCLPTTTTTSSSTTTTTTYS